MNKPTKLLAAAGALALGLSANIDNSEAAKEGYEKCYGVVKAGKNDCGSKKNKHSCAGQAATDSDSHEWLYAPEGLCERLTGGSAGKPVDAS